MKKLKWIILIAILGYGILKWTDLKSIENLLTSVQNQTENRTAEEDAVPEETETKTKNQAENKTAEENAENSVQNSVTESEMKQESTSGKGGVTPEFKEAMDSYEKYFDEYVAFMKKYSASDNSISMLAEYSRYMLSYADTMEKLDALEKEDMTEEDMAYYIDTMARIQKKLLEIQ